MVTRDRPQLARRAIRCLAAQTWPDLELVVIDDGDVDYTPAFAPLAGKIPVRYERLRPLSGRKLGDLRNLGLELARGELVAQWDDDEWYHPDRIATQVAPLLSGARDACVLKWTLMHLDTPEWIDRPYRADTGSGVPGTIVHRRTSNRYPNLSRAEDAKFLAQFARVAVLGPDASHLFIRVFHGSNTWNARHFERRLWRTPLAAAHWLYARARGDLRRHPQLQLTAMERRTIEAYLADSRELELLAGSAKHARGIEATHAS